MYLTLNFLFPLLLVLFEALVRSVTNQDIGSFIGPTLAAAAMAHCLALIRPREIMSTDIGNKKMIAFSKSDHIFSIAGYILVLLFLFLWLLAIFTSIWGTKTAFDIDAHLVIGLACYFFSCSLVSAREWT